MPELHRLLSGCLRAVSFSVGKEKGMDSKLQNRNMAMTLDSPNGMQLKMLLHFGP